MIRLLAWVGMALLAAFVVFSAGGAPGTLSADRRIVAVGAAAVLLVGWVVAWRRNPEWRPRSVLLPVIAIGLASLAISTAFSRFPRVSAEYLAYAIVLAALYLLLVRLLAVPFFRVRILAICSMMFYILTIGYTAIVVVHWLAWWSAVGHLAIPPLRPEFESLTLGNPSHVLMVAALLAVPMAASTPWTTRRGLVRLFVILFLTAWTALLTGSRAGWLALAVATVAGLVLLVAIGGRRFVQMARSSRIAASTRGRVAAIAVVGLALVPVIVLAPAVLRRAGEGGESLRLSYVTLALRMFEDAPVTGTGLGTWVVQRIAYTQAPEVDYYIPHAHDVYAQTLAEQGLIGALAGLVAIAALAWLLRDALRSEGPRRRWGIAAFIGLVYFGAHQVLDFNVNLPAVLFPLVIPIAYLDSTATRPLPVLGRLVIHRPAATAVATAFAAAVVISIAGLLWQELPARQLDEAVGYANDGDWASAREPALAAAEGDPSITSLAFTAGLAEAHAGNHAAAAGYFRAVAVNDDLPEAWLNLAAEDEAAGNRAAVAASIERALRLGYQRPAIAMAAGDLALRTGDEETALEAFTAAATTIPSLLADPWWRSDPAREAILPRLIAAAGEKAPTSWEIPLMLGDADAARDLATDDWTRTFVDAWTGDADALIRMRTTCRDEPSNLSYQLLCARAEGHAGNWEDANRYRFISDAQEGLSFNGGAELRVSNEPAIGRTLAGNPAIFWGSFTYRRPTPFDVLVPSLIHLTLE